MTIDLTQQDVTVLYGTLATFLQGYKDAEEAGAALTEEAVEARRMVNELFEKIDAGLPETLRIVLRSAAAGMTTP